MKFFGLSLLLASISFAGHAQNSDCEKALDDMQLMCEGAIAACTDLHDCLVRRDTCVEGVPKNETECQSLNTCMQDHKSDFISESMRCDYVWATPSSGESFCRVRKHFLFSEEGCPGRIHGLLNAFAYGLNSSVDSKFNCESVVKKRQEQVDSCEDRIRRVRVQCGSVPQNKRYLLQVGCKYATKFATYTNREFALQSITDRVDDGARRGKQAMPTTSPAPSKPSNSATAR